MKGKGYLATGLGLMALTIAGTAIGQMQSGTGPGPGMGKPSYDATTVITARGTVQEVKQISGRQGRAGTHLTLKTEAGTFDVHLGPSGFLKQEGFNFEKGDEIEVTGSKVAFQKGEAIIAREVKKGDKKLTLRDEKGFPVWSRRGRGPRSTAR